MKTPEEQAAEIMALAGCFDDESDYDAEKLKTELVIAIGGRNAEILVKDELIREKDQRITELSEWKRDAEGELIKCGRTIGECTDRITTLEAEVKALREGLQDLSRVCTCGRPSVSRPDGVAVAPGPHTTKCVHSRAAELLKGEKKI